MAKKPTESLKPLAMIGDVPVWCAHTRLADPATLKPNPPPGMVKKCPTLFNRNGYQKFLAWLATMGVKKVISIDHGKKHYLTFQKD